MSILTPVLQAGSLSARPDLQPQRCLNEKQNKYTCSVCTELCPEKLLTPNPREERKWTRCIDCGLCVAACPSRCFSLSDQTEWVLTDNATRGDAIVYACDREDTLLERKVPCLAGIPWELLALLSFYGDLVLYTKHCPDCDKEMWRSRVQENLDALRSFLGEERFQARVHLISSGTWTPPEKDEEREVSRQEIFSGLSKNLKKNLYRTAASRLPQLLDGGEHDAMQFRRQLSQAVLQEREKAKAAQVQALPSWTVSLPAYTTSCFGCSICERICPQKAVEIKAEAGGTRLIYITPWKCTACGLCAEICPHGGLQGMRRTPVPHLEQLPLVRVKSTSCEKCGTAIRPGSDPALCPACSAGKRRLRR